MDKDILQISLVLLAVLLFIIVLIVLLIFVNIKRKKYEEESNLVEKPSIYKNESNDDVNDDEVEIKDVNLNKGEAKKLSIICNNSSFKNYEMVNDIITIGRGKKCDLVIDDSYIGKYHSIIFYKDKSFFLADLNSKNGTYVENEKAIDGIYEIVKNIKVKIGYTEFYIILK